MITLLLLFVNRTDLGNNQAVFHNRLVAGILLFEQLLLIYF